MLDEEFSQLERRPELAGRGQRLAGAVIDGVFQAALGIPLMLLLGLGPNLWNPGGAELPEKLRFLALGWLVYLLLHGWTLHTRGQTLGKLIVGTRIVDLDGKTPPLVNIILRRVVPIAVLS